MHACLLVCMSCPLKHSTSEYTLPLVVVHRIDTSSTWPQLLIPQPLWGQLKSDVSFPIHWMLSSHIWPVPLPYWLLSVIPSVNLTTRKHATHNLQQRRQPMEKNLSVKDWTWNPNKWLTLVLKTSINSTSSRNCWTIDLSPTILNFKQLASLFSTQAKMQNEPKSLSISTLGINRIYLIY
jgi:hypothetical protein